jgi:alkylhydroperoxidase family enzyme
MTEPSKTTEPNGRERIAPLEPPYEEEVGAHLAKTMPRWSKMPPLRLFRIFARHFPMARALVDLGGFILARGALDPADREIVILRTCARCGAEYEWGVHAVSYPPRVGISPEQVAATFSSGPDDPVFDSRQALLVRISDALHETSTLDDDLWAEAATVFDEPQRLELLLVAGFYHFVSYVVNATRVEREPWAARFPN